MYPFKRVMVSLDLSYIDEAVVRYTNYLCRLLKPEALYFVHVYKDLADLEEKVPAGAHPSLPPDERLINQMQQLAKRFIDRKCRATQHFEVLEGQAAEQLLRWSHLKHTDLFIAGHKGQRGGSGLAPQRFAMLSDCSVLLVPETAAPEISTILIPVDFSDFGLSVVQCALALQQAIPGVQLQLQHVYTVPIGYYKTGLTFAAFADIMRFNATKAYYRFCRALKVAPEQLPCGFMLNKEGDIPAGITASLKEANPSLLLLGSHGRTAVSSFFMGSIAEKVVRRNGRVPTLIMKRKGKNLSFLEALFNE